MKQQLARIAGGYVDEKIVVARRLLREGKTLKQIGEVIGMSRDGAKDYLNRMGARTPRAR
jgi:hypothetical protein